MPVIYKKLNLTSFPVINRRSVSVWLNSVVESENKRSGEICIIFTNDETLVEINRKYLNHDSYTDIITFDYNHENRIEGDLFISAERVLENSKKFKVSFHDELLRVIVHGLLHLLGYDDKNPKGKKAMTEMENLWLERFNK
jgi:rRNA maturation RNase YbeY